LPVQYPPTPVSGNFPPTSPTVQTAIIPSYLYQQYSDDSNLQAFVSSQNTLAQTFLNTINSLNPSVYTQTIIQGTLLDWIGTGLYGFPRPFLSSGKTASIAEFGSIMYAQVAYGDEVYTSQATIYATSDDIYKRILTWHLYKGDGKIFNPRWLKRRIARFLYGANGTDPKSTNATYYINVAYASGNVINITLVSPGYDPTIGATFAACVQQNVIELPFQYTYNVTLS
jgi:hypothetical protein